MQITGMLWGSKLLKYVDFPTSEVLGPEAKTDQVKDLIDRWGSIFIKPIFKGGVGKKGKAGLIGKASDLATAMKEKERLYFVEHQHGNAFAKAEGVTFESAIPAKYELYVSITDSTVYRAPTLTITHHGGMDIEDLPKDKLANIPFDAMTGFKGFIVTNALRKINAPKEIISPLVQNLPKLWDLYHNYGMATLELNPIRMMLNERGRLIPVACDLKFLFDTDDTK
jgi:succinyl-CoA synthetase beta subunit